MSHNAPTTRMTKQRMVIIDELRKNRTHPTADEVYASVRKRLPRISLGTVYRNLDLLAASGDILKLECAGTIRRFDGVTRPHQHIRCRMCGCIGDVDTQVNMPSIHAVNVPGFTVTTVRLEFEGLCDTCTKTLAAQAPQQALMSTIPRAVQKAACA